VNLHTFTLSNPHITTREDLAASAILIYAMYRATNHYRHNRGDQLDVRNALRQWAREAVLNHRISMNILDNLWSPKRTPHHDYQRQQE
jgi:hypothetical protein